MRNAIVFISGLVTSVLNRILVFVFAGAGCGFALAVGSGVEPGMIETNWTGLAAAVQAGQLEQVIREMPLVGWYFLAGFIIGGVVFTKAFGALASRRKRLAVGGQSSGRGTTDGQVNGESINPVLKKVDQSTVDLFCDPEALMLTVPALLLFDQSHREIAGAIGGGKLAQPIESVWKLLDGTSESERYALTELLLQESNRNPDRAIKRLLEEIRDLSAANAWGLQCWIHMFLESFVGRPKTVKVKHKDFKYCVRELLEVISIGVSAGNGGLAELRFQKMWGHTGLEPMSVMPIDAYDFNDLDQSVQKLRSVPKHLREDLVNGYANSVVERQILGEEEAAIVRYMCGRWSVATRKKVAPGPQS